MQLRGALRVFVVATAALVPVAYGGSARADDEKCTSVTGTVATHQVTDACPSPIGVCFSGTLDSTSSFKGDTFFVASSATPDPSNPSILYYTGTLTVTPANGATTTFSTTGSIDQTTGQFVELDRAQAPANGTLTITGTTNAALTSFSGNVTGEVCRDIT